MDVDEDLIQYGLEEDVWFHADKLSSAHVYLRMNEGDSWEAISEQVSLLRRLRLRGSLPDFRRWFLILLYFAFAVIGNLYTVLLQIVVGI